MIASTPQPTINHKVDMVAIFSPILLALAGRTLPPAPGASRMAALRALHPDRKARGYSQKDASCATRKMRSRLVFFAAVWRGLFFLGYCRFVSSRRQASGDSPPRSEEHTSELQ